MIVSGDKKRGLRKLEGLLSNSIDQDYFTNNFLVVVLPLVISLTV